MLEINQLPLNYFSSKCGEIHCYNAIQFSITCNCCGLFTNSFAQFCIHYKDEHFEPAESAKVDEDDIKVEEFELIKLECDISNELPPEEISYFTKQATNSVDSAEYISEIEVHIDALPMETTAVKEDDILVETMIHQSELKENVEGIKENGKSKYINKNKNKPTIRFFNCKHCGKSFNNKSNRNMHEYRHNEIGDFHCNLCTKAFYTKDELNKHLRIHNDERSYVCEQCGKAFRHLWVLKKHIRTHSDQERTLPCPKCGKLFASKDNLRNHLPVHNTIPMFACEYCDKCFTSRKSLSAHSRRHHKNT